MSALRRPDRRAASPSERRWRVPAALLAITALALAVRVHGLGQRSFWYDEGVSAYLAETPHVREWIYDEHPPLYYALLILWRLPADGDAWLRLLSAILGVATIPIVYGLGAMLYTRAAGLWAAALLSVTYVHVQYSQEVRMYALMVLLFAGALWGLGLGALRHRRLGWIAYAACGAMLVYTHALGPLYVAVVAALFPLLAPDSGPGRSWRPWLLATAAVALSFLPWLPIFLERAREVASDFWVAPAGPEPPFFTTLQEFTVAPIPSLFSLANAWIGLPIGRRVLGRWVWFAPILGVALWILRRAWDAAPRATRALLAAYVLPIGMLASASLILRPILIPRVLLPTVIPIVLLLGAGADVLPTRRRANHAILTAVAAVLLLATLCFHARPAKEEWREMTWHLAARVQGTDLLLFDVDSWPLPAYLVARYDPSQRLGRLAHVSAARVAQSCRTDLERCLSGVFAAYPPGQRVWVVHAHERYLRGHEQVATWLHDRLDILETYPFAEIRLEYGRLRPPP